MALTNEQNYVIDSVLCSDDGKVIAINSVAGSGKTSTADALIRAYAPKTGFYYIDNSYIIR